MEFITWPNAEEAQQAEARLHCSSILDVDIHPIEHSPSKDEPAHYHLDVRFLMTADSKGHVDINLDECSGYQWVALNELVKEGGNIGRMALLAQGSLADDRMY